MNKFIINDTFDNLTFSTNDLLRSKTRKEILKKAAFLEGNNECDIKSNQNFLAKNVSVDDSVFLFEITSSDKKNSKSCEIIYNESSILLTHQNDIQSTLSVDENAQKPHNCNLAEWGLPEQILEKYKNRNITSMFPWQAKCLTNSKILKQNTNLVYSAPTSAGKTLVAEILAIKTVLERQKKVLFVLPFVSVVREKMFYFQDIFSGSGVRVEGFMGSQNPPGGFQSVQVAICTIEKANNIINRLLEEDGLVDIGSIIIDEIHLLGDSSRGYLLELMLTKLQYMTMRYDKINIQIIGMSATLPNLDLLGRWLKAEIFVTDFRPIPLHEQCLIGGDIYNKNLHLKRHLLSLPEFKTDTDNILQLCLETIENSCSVLIFCPTKNWCENLSHQIAVAFWKLGSSNSPFGVILRQQLRSDLISELLEQLRRCPVGLDKILEKTVSYGVAFHHAGLTIDERDIIESAFRNSILRVLIATSTLSSGVNLPARRVIIRTPIFHGKPIDSLIYRQMIGRAGRMGKDICGESILICQKSDFNVGKELLLSNLKPIESCLKASGRLKRAILEVIASGVTTTPDEVRLFTNCTLLAASENEDEVLSSLIDEALKFLCNNEFIRLQQLENRQEKYIATALGKACLSSSMAPEEGLTLFSELEKARQCFVLENELHLIYTVTPYSVCNQWSNIDWMLYLELWEKLPSSMKRVGELVGVRESFIVGGTRNKIQTNTTKTYQKLQIHKRFYTALALQDLVNEVPINQVAVKFNCARGMLQSLQQSAATFAGMLTIFSRQLGWTSMEILVCQFQDRLQFGVNRDLLDLMRLQVLNGPRARALFNAGIETLVQLASSDIYIIENILHKVAPFESEKEREGETEFDLHKRNKIRGIWITGKEGLTEREAAEMLIEDARRYLQLEMGLVEIKWEKIDKNQLNSISPKNNLSRTSNNSIFDENEQKQFESNTAYDLHLSKSIDEKENKINNKSTPNKIFEASDQSLFEDSFETKHHIDSTNLSKKVDIEEISPSYNGNSDSGLEFDNGSFLENAFVSNCNLNLDKSKNDSDNIYKTPSPKVQSPDLNDFVANSQLDVESVVSLESLSAFKTPKLQNTCKLRKKRLMSTKSQEDPSIIHVESPFTESVPLKKRLRIKNNIVSNDYDGCENYNFSKYHVVDVSNNQMMFKTFYTELFKQNTISLSLACSKVMQKQVVIGDNILNENVTMENKSTEILKFTHHNRVVNGWAITWSNNIVYYISLDSKTIVSNVDKVNMFKKLIADKNLKVQLFDSKEQIKVIKLCCGLSFFSNIEDPKVGDWLLHPHDKERNFQAMTLAYLPAAAQTLELLLNCKGNGSIGLDLNSTTNPKIRSTVEAIICWHLCEKVNDGLKKENFKLLETYKTEMRIIRSLAYMELNGIRISMIELQYLVKVLKDQINYLEKQAFSIAGRRFSITSSKEVSKIIGLHKGRKVSTNKKSLKQQTHPIANIILQWRKINSILTKMIYPLIRVVEKDQIYGCTITYTSTGRISMHEPNLQNIPRDFEISIDKDNSKKMISCRKAFVPSDNCVFLSADYCQLELRLLAHMSQDSLLCNIMRSDEDVFKSIAAKWKNIDETEVDDVLRQWAKQLCYGIIYGMGIKALAEQLLVSEEEAKEYMDSFHDCYPKIKHFIKETIAKCSDAGYIETIAGRKRYLLEINHQNLAIKAHAERQAVNTTVQGSAADLVKKAMVLVEENFQHKFRQPKNLPKLVLHLHDELLYEVHEKYLCKTAKILKKSMEEAVKLSIPFPVKLKSGNSWGCMKELVL